MAAGGHGEDVVSRRRDALQLADLAEAMQAAHRDLLAAASAALGKPPCPGIATGLVVSDAEEAEELADDGHAVVLARPTTDPDDVAAMSAAAAVLTELGGSTSHAAVVCREMAVPCVVGCGIGTVTALAGQIVTVDAGAGTVHLGKLAVLPSLSCHDNDLCTLERWLRDDLGEHDPQVNALSLLERRTVRGVAQ